MVSVERVFFIGKAAARKDEIDAADVEDDFDDDFTPLMSDTDLFDASGVIADLDADAAAAEEEESEAFAGVEGSESISRLDLRPDWGREEDIVDVRRLMERVRDVG